MKFTFPDPDAPMCSSGKRPFRTEELARARVTQVRYVRNQEHNGRLPGEVESGAFECAACGWWHLTSSTRARRRGELASRGRRAPRRR